MKNRNDPFGNRTRILPTFSAVPHITNEFHKRRRIFCPDKKMSDFCSKKLVVHCELLFRLEMFRGFPHYRQANAVKPLQDTPAPLPFDCLQYISSKDLNWIVSIPLFTCNKCIKLHRLYIT